MKRAIYLITIALLAISIGCFRGSIREGRSSLKIIYISELPSDEAAWSGLVSSIDQAGQNALVIVDDPDFSEYEDLAWWEGSKEVFILEQAGCDLLFPPEMWIVLGYVPLNQTSNMADMFIVALDVATEDGSYPLSRYLIRQQSPYRIGFSSALRKSSDSPVTTGLRRMPLDSILPVTATFLNMQADFMFVFGEHDSVPGVLYLDRGEGNRELEIKLVNRFDYKLKQRPFTYGQGDGINPLDAWKEERTLRDAEVLTNLDEALSVDSLSVLASKAVLSLLPTQYHPDSTIVLLPSNFFSSGLDKGQVNFGIMRKTMAAEVLIHVPFETVENSFEAKELEGYRDEGITGAVMPASRFFASKIGLTGITSARIVREMFNLSHSPQPQEEK